MVRTRLVASRLVALPAAGVVLGAAWLLGLGPLTGEPAASVAAPLLAVSIDAARESAQSAARWLAGAYAHAPALMLGLGFLLVAPIVALAGLALRARPLDGDRTLRLRDGAGDVEPIDERTRSVRVPARPSVAWIEVEGAPGRRWRVGNTLVRVGREEDNDIRLEARTVHRYHAVVHRSAEQNYLVTDLSGRGNGVRVNGRPVREARLDDGDRIGIGGETLRFRLAHG